MLSVVCPKRSFADSVVKSGSLWRLFRVLERREIFEDSSDSASGEEVDVASKRKARGESALAPRLQDERTKVS